jgi:hypothetical protein
MSKELTVGIVVLLLAGFGVYYLVSSPQFQELFSSRPVPPELLNREPGSQPRDQNTGKTAATPLPPRAEPPEEERHEEPVAGGQPADSHPSNEETGRVLLQILAARKLAAGINLTVSDQTLTVVGTVPTAEARRQILDVLNRGRGPRKIISDELIVDAANNGTE